MKLSLVVACEIGDPCECEREALEIEVDDVEEADLLRAVFWDWDPGDGCPAENARVRFAHLVPVPPESSTVSAF
jgi:hypothetical protein